MKIQCKFYIKMDLTAKQDMLETDPASQISTPSL